ncbi:hypothetical protein BJY04DRAFT_214577 [Aspergillus karnatakaensis]|uniref:uncharacterized protein n=1 Tax=Aspergillus karnatakaensis TaxID=1810916 RepID=UPI003CCCA3E8
MPSGSERKRTQLTIPKAGAQLTIPQIPKFPLSSPITEEVASPTSSSSEDRDMERNRPFEFLAKMSSKKPVVQKAAPDRIRDFERSVVNAIEGRGESSSAFETARKNSERPVGLNLDIPQATTQPRTETSAAFVDLNDLKVLSKTREDERVALKLKGILKKGDTRGFQRLPDDPTDSGEGRKRASLLGVVSKSSKKKARDDGISPTDRPIVIGFSVPYDSPELYDEKTKELDSAGTQQTPLTPSIVVTPAKEDSFWGHLSPEGTRPRAASSVYSRPASYMGPNLADAPPVPALPALYSTGRDEGNSTDLSSGMSLDTVRKRRSYSTGAVSEKTEKPPAPRSRSRSNEKLPKPSDRLTINTTLNARASQGWWSYLLSPLLSASSLLSPKSPFRTRAPPLPPIETSSTGLTDDWWDEKEQWEEKEKEISYFSPDTPHPSEAARKRISSWQNNVNGNPFADFDWSIEEQTEAVRDRGFASMMFTGQRIEGAAAEYYQACAHELFSHTPYFECVNHVCSITPKDKIPVVTSSPPLPDSSSQRGLLIDVDDVPRSNNPDSPASGITSINSSPSDDASPISKELHSSLKSSRALPSEIIPQTPKITSPAPEPFANTRQLDSPDQGESQSTNPFLQQREIPTPAPAPNIQIQQPAAPAPANISIESAPAPAPANIHIQVPTQPPPNFYFNQPLPTAPAAATESPDAFETTRAAPMPPMAAAPVASEPFAPAARTAPPPIAMPSPEQVPPPSYGAQPNSPYPRPPESLQERGAIRLSNMPAGPAPAYTPHDSSVGLPPRPRAIPTAREDLTHSMTERERIEDRLRRLEREGEIGGESSGWWKSRGIWSKKGCFGRKGKKGKEGRMKRRWYFAICLLFIGIVVGAVLLAIFLTRKGDGTPVQSQWLNLTGYPPMPTGISTIAGPEAQMQESGCINPSSMWSCALPKEQHSANKPYNANQPNFRVEIRFQNGTYDHSTAIASRSLNLLSRSNNQLFNPNPSPPSTKDQQFLGQYTDKTSEPYEGEETPFYITLMSTTQHLTSSSASELTKRDTNTNTNTTANSNTTTTFPDLDSIVPSPATDSDGSAAAAVLHPFPSSQPVRLYNRGKSDEHYGFYTYYDKSIFLSTSTPLTGKKDNAGNDTNGGSSKEDARVRCTWAQTRFLVQIWTRPEESGRSVLGRASSSRNETEMGSETDTDAEEEEEETVSSATDFTRPGSFPYPVTVTVDRHGGNTSRKLVYCYGLEEDMRVNKTEVKLQLEDRGVGGEVVNPAPGIFDLMGESGGNGSEDEDKNEKRDDEEEYGGYDGGTGGCSCQWVNWVGSS